MQSAPDHMVHDSQADGSSPEELHGELVPHHYSYVKEAPHQHAACEVVLLTEGGTWCGQAICRMAGWGRFRIVKSLGQKTIFFNYLLCKLLCELLYSKEIF